MFNKDYLNRVKFPAIMMFLVCACINGFGGILVAQFFAYLTCVYLVLKKGKPQKSVWLNYIVWTFLLTYGNLASQFGV